MFLYHIHYKCPICGTAGFVPEATRFCPQTCRGCRMTLIPVEHRVAVLPAPVKKDQGKEGDVAPKLFVPIVSLPGSQLRPRA